MISVYALFVKYVRFSSKYVETMSVTLTVIFVYSLNYGYLYLRTPFYLVTDEQKLDDSEFVQYGDRDIQGLAAIMRQGIYTDFSASWFSDIAPVIISSYVIICFIPAVEFLALLTIRYLLRAWD